MRKPTPAEAAALRDAVARPDGYVWTRGGASRRQAIQEAGWADANGYVNDAGRAVAAANPARVTEKGLAALRAAAADEHGWFPVETAPRVVGDLLRDGFARRLYPTNIAEISPTGREYVAGLDREG